MLASRLFLTSSGIRASALRAAVQPSKHFTTSARQCNQARASRVAEKMGTKPSSLKEKLMAPAGENAFGIGRGLVAGCAVVGLGSLCLYGSGLSAQVGIREKSFMWPQYIKERVKTTYMYFGGSLAVSAATAVAVFRTPALLRVVSYQSWVGALVSIGAMMGTGMICQSIPYKEGFGAKQVAWLAHSAVIGGVLAPLCLLGGPIVVRAATYTAGIVGGLSAIAVCAPSDKFLSWGAPLGMGFGLVFISSIGTLFLPPTTAIGASLYSISVYGGLALFSGLMLYDTQKAVKRAELTPPNSYPPFDPINNSVAIYLDAVNIFVRMVMILAGGGNRRR